MLTEPAIQRNKPDHFFALKFYGRLTYTSLYKQKSNALVKLKKMLKLAGSKNLKIYTREVFLEKNAFDEVTDEVVQTKN